MLFGELPRAMPSSCSAMGSSSVSVVTVSEGGNGYLESYLQGLGSLLSVFCKIRMDPNMASAQGRAGRSHPWGSMT